MSDLSMLDTLVQVQKGESLRDPIGAETETALGILIARYLKWDGAKILRTAAKALEEANFHSESAVVVALLRQVLAAGGSPAESES